MEHRSASSSLFGSSLIHKQANQAPILYITGSRTYNGIFTNKQQCTEATLWKEITSKQRIQSILKQWNERISEKQRVKNEKISMEQLSPFRMVLHKTNKMKLLYPRNGGMKGASKCKYFALLWIPSNSDDGMNEQEFNALIIALKQSRYFVNKLNKGCVYISGPSYGNDEETMSDDRPQDFNDDSEEKFDLIPLSEMCRHCMQLSNDTILDIEIVVHELDREKVQADDVKEEYDVKEEEYDISKSYQRDLGYEAPKLSIEMNKTDHQFTWHQQTTKRRISFGGSQSSQFQTQPLSHELYDEIRAKTAADREYHVCAFVWFKAHKKGSINDDQQATVNSDKTSHHDSHAKPSTNLSQSLLDDDGKEQQIALESLENEGIHDGVLPALSVMNKLHQQPYDGDRVYNVELMGYDECYENLDLVVDRNGLWKDAALVFIQALFLPFFIAFPPITWKHLCNKHFSVKPRYRPVGNMIPEFDDLERTEQIPWDISAAWKNNRIKKDGIHHKADPKKRCCLRFVHTIIGLIVWSIVAGGPFLYKAAEHGDNAKNLLFFDCFGPLILYGLGVFTVMWWACHSRMLIGPKEHLLLYNKLIVYRPIRKKEIVYNTPRTDWAALTNLSQPTLLTAFTYAFRKGFLELRTPTHELLSTRRFKCKQQKPWIMYSISMLVYFGAQNLENLEEHKIPFYVDCGTRHVSECYLRIIFCVLSNILSWILLSCFILLWETMIDRIARQRDNVRSLSNLITRNTYSEYIEFDYIDNILSWLELENFIKRKGMMLFSSLETPLFSLFVLTLISWSCTIYCVSRGVGLRMNNESSLFSNSALATWFYLAFLSLVQITRMLWYGRKFNRETEKQDVAIKKQCGTIHSNNLMQFLKKDKLSLEQTVAIQASQMLLTHINHNDIVPTVFGVKFDDLTAKAVWTAVFSAIPTIGAFIIAKIEF